MRAVLSGLLLLGALGGCLDMGPGRDVPRGAYALASVDGSALPFVMRDDAEVGRWTLRADTIFIRGGGRAERIRFVEVSGSTFQADTVMEVRHETNYRVLEDDRIEVGFFDCPINALCTPFATGAIIPGGFTLTVGMVTFAAVGVYLKAP